MTMINRVMLSGVAAALLVWLSGCASTTASGQHDQNVDFSAIERVAVVGIEGSPVESEAALNQIGMIFNQALMGKGYSAVERQQVRDVMQEQDFQASDATSAAGAAEIGRILNVDAAVIINVPEYHDDMSIAVQMVDVETAAILWSASGTATTGAGMGSSAGQLLGAIGGATAGHQVDDGGAGAVVGGVAGAAGGRLAGEAMTPQKQEQAAELIEELSETLPDSV